MRVVPMAVGLVMVLAACDRPAAQENAEQSAQLPLPSQTSDQSPPNETSADGSPLEATGAQPSQPPPDFYAEGVSRAASASIISQSAQSVEDWRLAVSRWQDAIRLLQSVPASSANQTIAQQKVKEYQQNLVVAEKQLQQLETGSSTPVSVIVPVSKPETGNSQTSGQNATATLSPNSSSSSDEGTVYEAPIRRRSGGTPIIEVLLNGDRRVEMIVDTGASGTVLTQAVASAIGVKPVGQANVDTASARDVVFEIGYVDSIEVNGALLRDVPVAIGPDLDIGLLGNDFFGRYDVTIREKVVEFRKR